MPQRLSQFFQVPASSFKKAKIFNAIVGVDSKVFIDPTLLYKAKEPEFKNARANVVAHFDRVRRLLKLSKQEGDIAWRKAVEDLHFKEEKAFSLGYGKQSNKGNAIGPELAQALAIRAKEMIDLGADDPLVFELIGLLEKRFGADRISDMTARILIDEFGAYSERVSKELGLKPVKKAKVGSKKRLLPVGPNGKPILLVPKGLLRKLPIALERDQVDEVAAFNDALRKRVNDLIAAARDGERDITKDELREAFYAAPKALQQLVTNYSKKRPSPYDVDEDPLGLFKWLEMAQQFVATNPLKLTKKITSQVELISNVEAIVNQFKRSVEDNRLYELLYDTDKRPLNEKFSQRLFYGIADSYCEANDLDLTAESNGGNGPVDFKISSGYNGRYLVEIKLSSNGHLPDGFSEQLPAYQKSEKTFNAALVIIRVHESEDRIKRVLKLRDEATKREERVPKIFVVDARQQLSASKRRRRK